VRRVGRCDRRAEPPHLAAVLSGVNHDPGILASLEARLHG
jgi:hypothetical protein